MTPERRIYATKRILRLSAKLGIIEQELMLAPRDPDLKRARASTYNALQRWRRELVDVDRPKA